MPGSEVVPGLRPAPLSCPPRSRRSTPPDGPSVSNAPPKSTSHWCVLSARSVTGRSQCRQPAPQTNHLFGWSFYRHLTNNYSQIAGKYDQKTSANEDEAGRGAARRKKRRSSNCRRRVTNGRGRVIPNPLPTETPPRDDGPFLWDATSAATSRVHAGPKTLTQTLHW